MASFLDGENLNSALADMIKNADRYLWLISPYIKINDRLKFHLNTLKEKPYTEVVIVFGKNESDLSKSAKLEDLEFFMELPNVKILHVANLHAKYYASEDFSIVTSMNLYEFSQVNNLEAGLLIQPKNALKKLASFAIEDAFDKAFDDANAFFNKVIFQGQILFEKEPKFKRGMLGLTEKYEHSEVIVNNLETHYKKSREYNRRDKESYVHKSVPSNSTFQKNYRGNTAYCIRTGVPIPYNVKRPFCDEAYESWNSYRNYDYPEAFCHSTGTPSYGKTSMRNPVLMSSNF